MAGIIYEANRIKVYEKLMELCEYAGESESWGDRLWEGMLTDGQLYDEFVYYLKKGYFQDKMKLEGYSMTDLYFLQMEKYNRLHDTGKNTADCKKTDMVLRAFEAMLHLKEDPQTWSRRFGEGRGMDRM